MLPGMTVRKGHNMDRKPTAARRAQIVDAAMRILATKGARRFTAQLLANEVGLTAGAIYRHFEGMDAIVDAAVERMGALLFEGFPPQAEDPIARLGAFFRHRTETLLAYPHVARLLHSDHLAQAAGPAQAGRLEEFKRRSQTFVLGCLREAHKDGTLNRQTSPEAGAIVVLGSILRLSHAGARIAGEAKIEQLSDEVWSALERALRTPRRPGTLAKPSKRRQPRRTKKKE
jgi:AcrR family transcriptional regulator